MNNHGLFSSLFIHSLSQSVDIDDAAAGRMATLGHAWKVFSTVNGGSDTDLWNSFLKQAAGYLEFVPPPAPDSPGVYPLYEDWGFKNCATVLLAVPAGQSLDLPVVGRFYPGKLIHELRSRSLRWGILTNGTTWRLYATTSSRPYEDYVELDLARALTENSATEYGLFEQFFHRDSFVSEENKSELPSCRLDEDRKASETVLDEMVKKPFLAQVDEVLQYISNGFIFDTQKSGEEYTEEERKEIFESAVKLIYRALFLFYAEARRLLPSDPEKADLYRRHSIETICKEAHKFRWGRRHDTDGYELWQHLKGLITAVNDGDPEYGIMGYNGGLFDDEEERFLRDHRLRNDFLARALYLLAYVEPYDNDPAHEYAIPYEDLEVRHLGELYENILEYTVVLADADRIRRRTKKGVEILLAAGQTKQPGDTFIKKGEVYFGESALERKQTGSYYTPESLVRFLNEKSVAQPLKEKFDERFRNRFDAFLRETTDGMDPGTQRGAAESAAELVHRFAEEELLSYTVCDPAMGSGHFLVDAANQMTGVVLSLLAEIPAVPGAASDVSNSPNVWRRRITRNCIYGVDLNPLAVNLAKLSLWLNCFASEHKLTFLDHHLRCGNSLIGIRDAKELRRIPKRKKDKKKDQEGTLFDVDDLSAALTDAAGEVAEIAQMDEDDTDRQRSALHDAEERLSRTRPLADLYTAYLMNPGIPADEYRQLFATLAAGKEISASFDLGLPQTYQAVQDLAQRHDYFHWPLEFPDVFGPEGASGFSATVGNPPWDVLQPNTQEFYVDYDPGFRNYKKQEALRAIKELNQKHPVLLERWAVYEQGIHEAAVYCKEPGAYRSLEKGKVDLYKAFLERFFRLLQSGGHMGIVVPSGIYTDQGCQPLREMFFEKSDVEFLYGFENRKAVFNIHRSFKFVVFGARKGGTTESFRCAFMEHDPERLPVIERNALSMSVEQVRKFSPATLSVMEFKSQRDIDITTKIYGDWPLLGDKIEGTWNVRFRQELNMTSDSHLFKTRDWLSAHGYTEIPGQYRVSTSVVEEKQTYKSFGSLRRGVQKHGAKLWVPMYKGSGINQFCNNWEEVWYWLRIEDAEAKVRDDRNGDYDFHHFRCGFRTIGRTTDVRTLISTVVQPALSSDKLPLAFGDEMNDEHSLYLASLLNSFALDYIIRQKVSATLNFFYVYSLPLPRCLGSRHTETFLNRINARALRLVCTTPEYASLWTSTFQGLWEAAEFWYPSTMPIDSYGPAHEQELRKRLRGEAASLTREWSPHCGVHDRLPDRRDTGDRAQLRAEIDAYVAHLYGLSRDDFAYILDTFPVLKNKEMKAFGEFMSKRKCLEEYDRIGKVLADG